MKNLVYIIALVFSTITVFGQTTVVEEEEKKEKSENTTVSPEIAVPENMEPTNNVLFNSNHTSPTTTFSIENTEGIYEFKDIKQFERAKSEFQLQYKLFQTSKAKKSLTPKEKEVLQKQLDVIETFGTSTFEYNFYTYLLGNYNTDQFKYLQNAELLNPEDKEVWEEMFAYFHIMGNQQKAQTYLEKLVKAKVYDESLLSYAEDVIRSAKNGVILTHGEKDTYPLFIAKEKLAANVEIINVDFLTSKTYRNHLKSELFSLPEGEFINTVYVAMFCQLNASKNIQIALSLPSDYLLQLNGKLETKGLTYAYRQSVTLKTNQEIWNSLGKSILTTDSKMARSLSANYLPLVLTLYKAEKDTKKKEAYKNQLEAILKRINKEDQLEILLDAEE